MYKYLLILLFLFTLPVLPQQEDPKFQLALSKYGSGQYNEALKLFTEVYTSTSAYRSAALLFQGKTEFRLQKTEEAKNTLKSFLALYPAGVLRDEARTALCRIYLEEGDAASAMNEILSLIDETRSKDYLDYAKTEGSKIADAYMTAADLDKMLDSDKGKKSRPYLLLLTGKSYLKINNKLDADAAFLEVLQKYPDSPEREEASALYRQELKKKNTTVQENSVPVIVALLPLTKGDPGEENTAAKEILEGIKYAVSEYNSDGISLVGLLIRNTYNIPARIEEIGKELERIPSLKVIVGPIFSDEVRSALRVFKSSSIPIISPTATDNDLTQLNDFFFQANPTFLLRGKAMAQYVYYVEKKQKIGVLNAVEGYSPSEALGFTSEFERLGGQIIARETYNSGNFDFQNQIRILAGYPELEGLYVPLADKADAAAIINELAMNNVNLPVYGNQDWYYLRVNPTLSGLNGQLTFSSDHFIDFNSTEYQEFARKFTAVTSMEASRNVFYGYDAAKFIFSTVMDWNSSPPEISLKFKNGRETEGYHNDICFDGGRINNCLNIIRFRDGVFELAERYKISGK